MYLKDVIKRDSRHEIVRTFENGAELHRFNNEAGVPYSAIYEKDEKGEMWERWSHTRDNEERMVKDYLEWGMKIA